MTKIFKLHSFEVDLCIVIFICVEYICLGDFDNLQDTCPTATQAKQTIFINGFNFKNPARHTQTIKHGNKYKYSHLQQAKQAKKMTNYPSAIILAQIILYRMTKTKTLLHPKHNDNSRITN